MRKWLIGAGIAALVLAPRPAWSQTSTTCTYNCDGKRGVGQAVSNTVAQSLKRRQFLDAQINKTMDWIKNTAWVDVWARNSWLDIARVLGLSAGASIGEGTRDLAYCAQNPKPTDCGDGYGGGGASSDIPCADIKFNLDASGNVIVPAMKLPSPAGITYGAALWYVTGGQDLNTTEPLSAIKVGIHQFNLNQDSNERYAPLFIESTGRYSWYVYATFPAYYSAGKVVKSGVKTFGTGANLAAWTAQGLVPPMGECPEGIARGTGKEHYMACINPPTNWAIATHGAVPPHLLNLWAKGNDTASTCPVSSELIRFLADRLFYEASKQAGYDGVPYERVEKEDVRNGGEQPTIRETGTVDKPTNQNTTPGEPTTQPTPEPSSTPSSGPDWTDPGTQAPNPEAGDSKLLVESAFNWFPDLPKLQINLGSQSCPVYKADFYGHELVLDSHCPFIEQNRAIISALMIILFTIAAAIIVLRA